MALQVFLDRFRNLRVQKCPVSWQLISLVLSGGLAQRAPSRSIHDQVDKA